MKLVLVDWFDHSSSPDGWHDIEEYQTESFPLACQSVGWVVHEDKDIMVIVPHRYLPRDGYKQRGSGDLTVLKRAIKRIKVLKG